MKKGLLVFQNKTGLASDRSEFIDQLGKSLALDQYRHIAVVGASSSQCHQDLSRLRQHRPQKAKPAFESDIVLGGYSLKSHQVERLRSFGVNNWDVCGHRLEAEILGSSFVMHDAEMNLMLLVSHTFSQTNEGMRISLLDLYRKHFGADSLKFGVQS